MNFSKIFLLQDHERKGFNAIKEKLIICMNSSMLLQLTFQCKFRHHLTTELAMNNRMYLIS